MGMPTYPSDDKSVQYNIVAIRLNHEKLPSFRFKKKKGKLVEHDAT